MKRNAWQERTAGDLEPAAGPDSGGDLKPVAGLDPERARDPVAARFAGVDDTLRVAYCNLMTIDITSDSFQSQVLEAKVPVLVDFWADWCMPCKMIEPILTELSDEYDGSLVVGRVNVDEAGDLASTYNIVSIPSILLFKDGAVVAEHVGAAPKDTFVELIQGHAE